MKLWDKGRPETDTNERCRAFRGLSVLEWPGRSHRHWNAYNGLLHDELEKLRISVGDYVIHGLWGPRWDVVHVHWPDGRLNNPSWVKAFFGLFWYLCRISWFRSRGSKVIWTMHNLRSHGGYHPRLERVFWRCWPRFIDGAITMADIIVGPETQRWLGATPCRTIPHGNYRSAIQGKWTRTDSRTVLGLPSADGWIVFFGQVKRYKGVPRLIEQYMATLGNAGLLIAGKPEDELLQREIETLAKRHPRIVLRLTRLSETEMEMIVSAADLVVLPYEQVLNSGTAMFALSANRPVFVPSIGTMTNLKAQFGAKWVKLFEAANFAPELKCAFEEAKTIHHSDRPDLSSSDWETVALAHKEFFEELAFHQGVAL